MQFASANPGLVQQQMGGMGGGMPAAPPQATAPRVADEPEQIDSSSRSSAAATTAPAAAPAAAANPFGGAGMPNMEEMMNNPMVKDMMSNPETMKMMQNMMQGQGGAGDPAQMSEMMKNPNMATMLQNPEMISNCINMVKSNPAMMEMVAKQMPGVDPQTVVKGLEWMAALAGYYATVRRFFANKFVQLSIIALVVSLIWRWFG